MSASSYFFGIKAGERNGHFGHTAGVYRRWLTTPEELPWRHLDGQLTPKTTTEWQTAALHHKDGFTALGIHDHSAPDKRAGCNAVFIVPGELTYLELLDVIVRDWPDEVARIGNVELVEVNGEKVAA